MLVQNKYTSCMSNFCILNFLNNYTTYSRYFRKPTFFELSIPLKRSPSMKTEFLFFLCDSMRRYGEISKRESQNWRRKRRHYRSSATLIILIFMTIDT